MNLSLTFIILFISSLFGYVEHDYHVGQAEIHHNTKNKSLETSISLFTDDVNDAIFRLTDVKINLGTPEEDPQALAYLERYVRKNVRYEVNQKEKSFNFIGKEHDKDVTWIYLEAKKVKKIKSFLFTNTLLFGQFDDQKNIINFVHQGKTKGCILKSDEETCIIDI